ncbi:hypothetical protein TMA_034 [Thermus phage TMA]|uniref:hypothetical protein n=1 Tax=Thermus phage TMA TaxID=699370 RepID=UPI00021AAE34|nr:hypothetical protein TMA_034 [Thermus phage TMA]BAK53722.1 hypothetical protein TMA_034 [Thermus phage TMA]
MELNSDIVRLFVNFLGMIITSWATFSLVVLIGSFIIKQKPSFRDISWGVAGFLWIISNLFEDLIGRKLDLVEVFIVASFAISLMPFWNFWLRNYFK